jgi:hypothetical protein
MVSVSAGRAVGPVRISGSASAKFSFYENTHGYRAGNRYGLLLGVDRGLGTAWGANAGVALDREEAEKWSGRIEEEGNLGRTDLMLSVGVGHTVPGIGGFGLAVRVPIKTWATGEQVKYPVIISMKWAH